MKIINKKGFTLIELLAVIVVLAVVMLIAVTAVVPMMERARKQAFITEVIGIIEASETYYMLNEMSGTLETINRTKGGSGKYVCIDIKDDLMGEYISDKGKQDYDGVITYKIGDDPFSKGLLYITNGKYEFRLYSAQKLTETLSKYTEEDVNAFTNDSNVRKDCSQIKYDFTGSW